MGPRSPEGKAAKAILDALDKASVNEQAIAYMLYNSPSILHDRLFRVFMWLIRRWAQDYDEGNFDLDNMDTKVQSKRIVEHMERYHVYNVEE